MSDKEDNHYKYDASDFKKIADQSLENKKKNHNVEVNNLTEELLVKVYDAMYQAAKLGKYEIRYEFLSYPKTPIVREANAQVFTALKDKGFRIVFPVRDEDDESFIIKFR